VFDIIITSAPAPTISLRSVSDLRSEPRSELRSEDWIGSLSGLQELDVSCNQLQSLPESTGLLSSLRVLYVTSNQLHSLPKSICSLSRLQELDVASNQLQSLPDSIGSLTALVSLDITSNSLSSLPNSILSLPNGCDVAIFHIVIRGNQFSLRVLRRLQEQMAQPGYHGPRIELYHHIDHMEDMEDMEYLAAIERQAAEDWPLEEIVAQWYKGTQRESDPAASAEKCREVQSEPYARSFCRLLIRLQDMPDYQNARAQPLLKERVITILEQLLEDKDLRGQCFSIAEEGGLDNLELAILNHRARKGELNETQLLGAGRGLFRMCHRRFENRIN
jgi:Leucine-rich repeat (LRR) protein